MANCRLGRWLTMPLMPNGVGKARIRSGSFVDGIRLSASGSKSPQTSLNVSMSSLDTRSERTWPSVEKFSRITATTRLSTTMLPSTMNETKYGTAMGPPQLPSAAEHLPESSVTSASTIMPLQLSPVRHWNRSSIELPSVLKLRLSVMFSCATTNVNRLTPSTPYMKTTSERTPPTFMSGGNEMTSVIIRSRIRRAPGPLSRRRMRRMRSTRSTRSTIGGMGRTCSSSSAANWSSSEVHTRVKSNRHQLSPK